VSRSKLLPYSACAADKPLARLAPWEEEYAFDEGAITLRVVRRKPVDRDEIVFAPGLLELTERNTLGFAERRVLLRRHACGLAINDETVAQVSQRIGKASPAFIKELARRAAQAMMGRGGERLEDADFARAFEDMSGRSSKITARLLGAEGLGFVTP
jgi:hypothetical protein